MAPHKTGGVQDRLRSAEAARRRPSRQRGLEGVFWPGARRRKGADLSSLEKLETLIINSQNPIDLLTKSGLSSITIEFRALVYATLAAIELVFDRLRDMTMQKFHYGKHIVFGPFLY
jgi:hypothetical protein